MPVYLYRLTPPKPDFPADMSEAEGAAMQRHFGYWADLMNRGAAVAFGPVADPKGTYGIAVLTVAGEAEARALCANDPVITAQLGFTFQVYEMPGAVVKAEGEPN
jgi:hypothetical protein